MAGCFDRLYSLGGLAKRIRKHLHIDYDLERHYGVGLTEQDIQKYIERQNRAS